MKTSLFFSFIGFLLAFHPLCADYDLEDVGSWEIEKAGKQGEDPYQAEFSGDWIGDSKFTQDSVEGDHIRYGNLEAELEALGYWDECHREGFKIALSYEQSHLDWASNPFFDRRHFNTASLALLAFTERFCGWTWIGQARYNIDANNWGFVDYSTYDWLVWGRYSYRQNIGLHLGVYAQTGIHLPLVLPIVGLDWQFLRDWKLSCVFPLNISLVYALDACWNLRLGGRWWSDRHRVGKHEHLMQAIWRYSNYGVELGTSCSVSDCLRGDLHAGLAFCGKVKVADRGGHESKTFRFKPAAYFGGELVVNF
jgi:hypothetical protein